MPKTKPKTNELPGFEITYEDAFNITRALRLYQKERAEVGDWETHEKLEKLIEKVVNIK